MENNMVNRSKTKTYAAIVFLVILGVAVTIGSFALWNQTRKQSDFNAIVAACLDLTIEDESEEITMDYAYPITNTEGLATTGYTFTVTNTCAQPVSYTIAIESVDDHSGKQFIGNNYLNVSLDGKSPSPYGSLDTAVSDTGTSYTIRETRSVATRRVNGNSSRTHTIRMWLDKDTPLSEQNKTFVSKVKLTGGQGIEAGCYTVNGNGVLTDYDPECGRVATVPASVNGHNITTISSNAFKSEEPEFGVWGRADSDSSNNPLQSIDDSWYMSGQRCYYNGYTDCLLDFTYVFPYGLYQVFADEDVRNQIMQDNGITTSEGLIAWIGSHYSIDDVFAIINYTGNDATRISRINEAINSEVSEQVTILGWDIEDLTIYQAGDSNIPKLDKDHMEQYFAIQYREDDGGLSVRELGVKTPTGNVVNRLSIDSLDLSQATYLTRIEPVAFSNVPNFIDIANNSLNMPSIPTGLTSLTLSSKSQNTLVGGAAFAFANLNSLTIYTPYQLSECDFSSNPGWQHVDSWDNPNDFYALYGAFFGSTIGTLNVVDSDNIGVSGRTCRISVVYTQTSQEEIVEYPVGLFGGMGDDINVGTLNLANNISSIGAGAFAGVVTPSLTLPSNLSAIGNQAFYSYKGTSLSIPSGVNYIGTAAFRNYVGTGQNLTIPSSVTTIEEDAFYRFNGSSLTFNEGLETLKNSAFQLYNGSSFTIPSTIRTLGTENSSVFAFFEGTANINMTEANFNASVSHSNYWNLRGTNQFLSN